MSKYKQTLKMIEVYGTDYTRSYLKTNKLFFYVCMCCNCYVELQNEYEIVLKNIMIMKQDNNPKTKYDSHREKYEFFTHFLFQ
jgi:hypothetical protein